MGPGLIRHVLTAYRSSEEHGPWEPHDWQCARVCYHQGALSDAPSEHAGLGKGSFLKIQHTYKYKCTSSAPRPVVGTSSGYQIMRRTARTIRMTAGCHSWRRRPRHCRHCVLRSGVIASRAAAVLTRLIFSWRWGFEKPTTRIFSSRLFMRNLPLESCNEK